MNTPENDIKRDLIGEAVESLAKEHGQVVPLGQPLFERALDIACRRLADAACPQAGDRVVYGLTAKQKKALDFITAYIAEHGYSPCYREIAAGLALKSKSGVSRLVHALRERGRIDLTLGRRRDRSIAIRGGGR